jgi:hypothetical protein
VNKRQVLRTGIALVVMILILGAGAVWGWRLVSEKRELMPEPCVTLSMTELKPTSVVVRVYNGGSIRGLAGTTAKVLKSAGFIVTATANTEEAVHNTVVVGVTEDSPEVRLVASYFKNVEIRADNRADHSVDVLVGEADAPLAETPLTSVTLPSGTACVPQRANPTPTVSPSAAETPE